MSSAFRFYAVTRYTHMHSCTAIQGLGSGGIQSTTEVIMSDLVPLVERGIFFGIIGRYVYTSCIRIPLMHSQCLGYSLYCRSSWRR